MRQVVQSYRTGEVRLRDVPVPHCGAGRILVRNQASLVSIGTERSTIELGRKSLLGKAAARPDLVRRVVDKARKEGLLKTWQEAMGRLDTPTPLGYSSAGVVEECGVAATAFAPGDRVACVGQGFASHAEFVSVPVNLAARIPDGVTPEAAAFGMLGTIALHGVRCAELTPGSTACVLGLGLLGQLTVQMLDAYGVSVVGYDPAPDKAALAAGFGGVEATADAAELERLVAARTGGHGADAVVITAATKSRGPVDLAIRLSRVRGRVVLVGVADIHPNRNEMWLKEVSVVVSRAGGPGALDPVYEVDGVDLPVGDVRWTQGRNLREFLRLLERGKVDVGPLVTHRFPIAEAEAAYARLLGGELESPLGVLLEYPTGAELRRRLPVAGKLQGAGSAPKGGTSAPVQVGVLGAGLFGKALLLPALAKVDGVSLHTLVTASGANVEHVARRFGFRHQATDEGEVWRDPEVQAVVGLTPHSRHAGLVRAALEHGKPLFLEKPLCVTEEELAGIRQAVADTVAAGRPVPWVLVGHNRRFSPHTRWMRTLLEGRQTPVVAQLRVNTGFVPPDHWVHSEAEGRSRVVGEMSHFVDLLECLVAAPVARLHAERVSGDGRTTVNNDNLVVSFKFADGSVAALTYTASGDKAFSREALELHFDGRSLTSRDFHVSEAHGVRRGKSLKTRGQQMGYGEELRHFADGVAGRAEPELGLEQALITMETVFAVERSLATGRAVSLG